jgi:hypothetical protein
MDGVNLEAAGQMPLQTNSLELEGGKQEEEGVDDGEQEEQEEDEDEEDEEDEEEENNGEEQPEEESATEDGTEDDVEEEDEQEHAAPVSKRRRLQPGQRPPRMQAGGGASSRKHTNQPRPVKRLAPPCTLTSTDHVLVPSIQLQAPIPVELLLRGLSACMRWSSGQHEPAQAALFDALYGIRMELEDRMSDGDKLAISYYKQAKRNDERQPTALFARKMERPRAAKVLEALLKKWQETSTRLPQRGD